MNQIDLIANYESTIMEKVFPNLEYGMLQDIDTFRNNKIRIPRVEDMSLIYGRKEEIMRAIRNLTNLTWMEKPILLISGASGSYYHQVAYYIVRYFIFR